MERYFFEIPIYRCSPEKHNKETDDMHEEAIRFFDVQKRMLPEHDFSDNIERRFLRLYSPYDYNEVIGWIRLYILGTQIRGRYYFESDPKNPELYKTRINRGIRKKRFIDCGKAFEMSTYKDQTSTEIFSDLLEELERLNKEESPFKKRYLDLEQLKKMGPFVDWKYLVQELNPFKM